MAYPVALVLTVLIELPVWVALLRARLAVPTGPAVVVGVVVNVVSHPLLWFVLVPVVEEATGSTVVAIVIAEGGVALLEAGLAAVLVQLLRRRRPSLRVLLLVAGLANTLSLAVGVLLAV